MLTPNAKISEGIAVVGTLAANSQSAGAKNSGWISAKDLLRIYAIVGVGTLGSSATVDAKIQQATDSSGTGAKDITGKAITQLTAANQQVGINLSADDFDAANSFNYFQVSITVAVAASVTFGAILATTKQGSPDSYTTSLNAASLVQIVG